MVGPSACVAAAGGRAGVADEPPHQKRGNDTRNPGEEERVAPAEGCRERHQQHRRHEGAEQVRAEVLRHPHREPAPFGPDLRRDHRLADRHDAAFGRAHQEARTEQHRKGSREAREKRASRECERRQDQQALAAAGAIRHDADAKGRTGPCERERARQYPDLGIGKTQVRLHERHQEVERVAIEEDDAEIEA
jgi:hypothetical protein